MTLRPTGEGRERTRSLTAFAGTKIAVTVTVTVTVTAADEDDLRVVARSLSRMDAAVTSADERLHRREGPGAPTSRS